MNMEQPDGARESRKDKNHQLFLRQKALLDLFLQNGALTRAQHDKSLHDLREKMSEPEETDPRKKMGEAEEAE